MYFKRVLAFFSMLALMAAPYTWADNVEDMVANLQKQMGDMQRTIQMQNQKIQQLETRPSGDGSAAAVEVPPPMSDYEFNERLAGALGGANKWLKDLKFSADMRLRYEAFSYKNSNPSTHPRNRFRFRLRFGFEKKFKPDMTVGFYLASGSLTDPNSTNETLDNNFAFKQVVIERVYAFYDPSWAQVGPIKKLRIAAGKWQNPFERGSSEMIWDRDVRPEGAYEMIDLQLFKNNDFDLTGYFLAGQMILDEDSGGIHGDAELFAFQGGLNAVVYTPFMQRPVDVLSAMSFYYYDDYAAGSNFFANGANLARGNVVSPVNSTFLAARHFNVVESYTEVAFYPWGVPVRPFFDFAFNPGNSSPDNRPTGYVTNTAQYAFSLGGKLGSIVKKGDWELYYAYRFINNNAVVGAFPDSDFTGDSNHVGKKGNVFKAAYALTDNLQLNGAIFLVNNLHPGTVANLGSGAGAIDKNQQFRSQVDLLWKF